MSGDNYSLFSRDAHSLSLKPTSTKPPPTKIGRFNTLEALHSSDLVVGPTPSDGAHASLREIRHFLAYFKKLIINEIKANIDFVTKSADNIWWYDGQIVKFRSHNTSKILFALQENPAITYEELTKLIGINTSAIQKQINNLIKNGYIQRKNSDSEWYVLITSTI